MSRRPRPALRALAALLLAAGAAAAAHDDPHPSSAAAERMTRAVRQFLAVLPAPERAKAQLAFDDRDRLDWHYTPRGRQGVSLKELDAKGREAAHELLRQALSASGYRRVTNIIELEAVLREMETFGGMRDPERYHVTVYGTPGDARRWGWRFEGHHLSLNFTLAGERLAADAPSFLGANPAAVASGPRRGLRALAAEEDEARELLSMLSEAQRREAVFDDRTYGDIVTANAGRASPLEPAAGIAASRLDARQQAQLMKVVETYAGTFEPGLARARMARVREGGIAEIRFGWAGSTRRGEPHYYRIQGPRFLIEYDASQNGGNHVHTVWRDFEGDFGRDLLREHHALARGTSHRH